MNLCEFKSGEQWKLVYRASENGFDSSSFHYQCDDKKDTLTIIKTDENEVFGGYTKIEWNQPIKSRIYLYRAINVNENGMLESNFKSDKKAFIFSLKNLENRPKKIAISNPKKAIYCDDSFGPAFGDSDLVLKFVNNRCEGVSVLKADEISESEIDNYYSSERSYFNVVEIEVFNKN